MATYGAPAMLLSWVPVIGDTLVFAAGAARMPMWPFLASTVVGKTFRYLLVANASLQAVIVHAGRVAHT